MQPESSLTLSQKPATLSPTINTNCTTVQMSMEIIQYFWEWHNRTDRWTCRHDVSKPQLIGTV